LNNDAKFREVCEVALIKLLRCRINRSRVRCMSNTACCSALLPVDKVPPPVVREILSGGAHVCTKAGIPVAGGHSIDSPEPIYGLAVIGVGHPKDIRRNSGAKPGDALILTKALGVGVYSAAFKKGGLSPEAYAEMIASMTLLNSVGIDLAKDDGVHAITDVSANPKLL
jgi:selenide, water dikinase